MGHFFLLFLSPVILLLPSPSSFHVAIASSTKLPHAASLNLLSRGICIAHTHYTRLIWKSSKTWNSISGRRNATVLIGEIAFFHSHVANLDGFSSRNYAGVLFQLFSMKINYYMLIKSFNSNANWVEKIVVARVYSIYTDMGNIHFRNSLVVRASWKHSNSM